MQYKSSFTEYFLSFFFRGLFPKQQKSPPSQASPQDKQYFILIQNGYV